MLLSASTCVSKLCDTITLLGKQWCQNDDDDTEVKIYFQDVKQDLFLNWISTF